MGPNNEKRDKMAFLPLSESDWRLLNIGCILETVFGRRRIPWSICEGSMEEFEAFEEEAQI
jgi:hypothetical protein